MFSIFLICKKRLRKKNFWFLTFYFKNWNSTDRSEGEQLPPECSLFLKFFLYLIGAWRKKRIHLPKAFFSYFNSVSKNTYIYKSAAPGTKNYQNKQISVLLFNIGQLKKDWTKQCIFELWDFCLWLKAVSFLQIVYFF